MARVYHPISQPNDCWYEELNLVSSISETDLENKILQNCKEVFAEYNVISFKYDIVSGKDTKRPDLLMIDKNYKEWWFIEVEKISHTLNHIIDQVNVFKNPEFNSLVLSKYIVRKGEEVGISFDESKVYNLIDNIPPKVMVIIDQNPTNTKLHNELNKIGVKLCVFQIFKNTNSTELYRINGFYPYVKIEASHCKINAPGASNVLTVINSDILNGIADDVEFSIYDHTSRITVWKKKTLRNKVYISSVGANPILTGKDYVLIPNKVYEEGDTISLEKDSLARFHLKIN
ncbi:hypothetical protein BWI93_10335 [Siphonobacter sp. BAB-5385]|uniref:hypothetical protein n=1 Tax=Siphonobacter sp. BAB-5385 TaxID=1864822 RepID=UPI000B9E2AF4|nr:hypothetical protein [Siphonobacter sp. BAB-5385]OZI08256.1 hypothetical protein BWI93_10335 [Siphonobacter sp. BAB-5385]